ncbi:MULTISPECIES: SHOCT domain-containing protein [Bradyrhizobium]|uniref:SHOCT domain-containing protein n=1 Tax=Bradyrhizobium elkanii TaxID=29448 RepID=UPI00040A771D|nr:SHOCT domain-containing protein [Bradyrhizobium elkanii]
MTDKITKIKELVEMRDQGLISQDEFEKLRAEVIAMPAMGSTGQPFSLPSQPQRFETVFRNPQTGAVVRINKGSAFWLTFFFGCFYLAYKEVWLHAGIALLLALLTSGLMWPVYAFFAYRIIVDSYRRKGWIELDTPPVPFNPSYGEQVEAIRTAIAEGRDPRQPPPPRQ